MILLTLLLFPRPEDGLHELVLKGVKHPGTQRLFKDGLVKESGIFTVINQ